MSLKNSYMAGFETHRDFVRVKGADSLRFLQGMWTSDLKLAESAAPATTHSFLLGLKGKPVAPAQILCLSGSDFVLGVPEGWGEKTKDALDRYIVADDVELSLEKTWKVWTLIDDASVMGHRISPRVSEDASRVFRAEKAGANSWILPVGRFSPNQIELWLEDHQTPPAFRRLDAGEQTALRLEAGLPEWGRDFGEESLILEFPFADEISFHKGCYIGQEVVARGTYRGQVPKAFARFMAGASLKEGGFVYREADDTKPIGKMTTVLHNRALGQLRLREIEGQTLIADRADGQGRVVIDRIDFLHTKVV
jgi:aminomethyltransferase